MELLLGDCLDRLKELEDNSVDAIVCDPPYGLSFMGKKWDYDVPQVEVWKECLRVLKPGGYLLAFAGTRTQHRMAVNIEDAGFEIRDMIAWVYGSGFPKSLNIGKAVDKIAPRLNQFDEFAKHLTNQIQISGKTQKEIASLFPSKTGGLTGCVWNWANGANVPTVAQWNILKPLLNLSDEFMPLIERIEREREVVGKTNTNLTVYQNIGGTNVSGEVKVTKGTSEWEGWGSSLKPALEPITVARKPLEKGLTIAQNCLKWGVGGINIDGCRVGTEELGGGTMPDLRDVGAMSKESMGIDKLSFGQNPRPANRKEQPVYIGRFPANLIHDGSDEVRECFPETTTNGVKTPFVGSASKKINLGGGNVKPYETNSGNASRFFYCAKASKRERNIGCEGLELTRHADRNIDNGVGGDNPRNRTNTPKQNFHPTVKPIALMEYLVKMVSKEGHIVLDPFMGSGTTGMACKKLNRDFIGIEMMPEYMEIAKCRIDGVEKESQLNML